MHGYFIALEGLDGCGKTTQARFLARFLWQMGIDVVLTREPGEGLPMVRDLVLQTANISPQTQYLLFSADRAEHVRKVILPALQRGQWVVSDRYVYSSFAYQGYGHGLSMHWLKQVASEATMGVMPHLTILLDIPVHVAMARVGVPDSIESMGQAFYQRVRHGYLHMACENPNQFLLLDGTRPVRNIARQIRARVLAMMQRNVL